VLNGFGSQKSGSATVHNNLDSQVTAIDVHSHHPNADNLLWKILFLFAPLRFVKELVILKFVAAMTLSRRGDLTNQRFC
jgi:hypothetical protein